MINNSYNTAISRKTWSVPGRWLYENFFKDNIALDSMLDFGAGRSIDSECWSKATGADAAQLTEALYEGFGPEGVGILVKVVTDNTNPSVNEIKLIFTKQGGSFASAGAVS